MNTFLLSMSLMFESSLDAIPPEVPSDGFGGWLGHVGSGTTLPRCGATVHRPSAPEAGTKEAIELLFKARFDFRLFSTGASFAVGDVLVDTFSVPHDAYDPVGFLVRTSAGNCGFLTDLGHATKLAVERVRAANVLVLEANHDVKMLQDDPRRPWSLKQRILSRHGHLSNDAAGQLLARIDQSRLNHVLAAHLSRQNNRPELAQAALAKAWGVTPEVIGIVDQDAGLCWVDLE